MNRLPQNFLFLFPDQWRGECLGASGNNCVRTPFCDSLAYQGIRFANAYTPAPTCIPARASLLTGKSPYLAGRTGYQDKVPWNYEDTLVTLLNDANYQTINVGKTHFYPQSDSHGFERNRLYDPLAIEEAFESEYHVWLRGKTGGDIQDTATIHSNNTWVPLPWSYPEYLHPTNWTADTAIEELANRDNSRPFFMQVGFHRPHPPYDPPTHYMEAFRNCELPPVARGEWSEKWNHGEVDAECGMTGRLPTETQDESRRAYYASINHVDHQIGKIMHWLREHDLQKNTFIILASDHGELLGDHNRRHKIIPLEGSVRIPLIIVPPEASSIKAGRVVEHPIALQDLTPTILHEAGVNVPVEMDSVAFNDYFRNGEKSQREYIHGEHASEWQFVTDGKEKLIWNSYSGEIFFFSLKSDPTESENLAENPDYKERISLWKGRLIKELSRPYRIADGLSDGKRLISGKTLEAVNYTYA